MQSIDTADRAAVQTLYNTTILPSFSVPMQWTGIVGSCEAGTTSAAWKAAVVRTVNSFRVMAGLPGSVKVNIANSALDQQAALMMDANSNLSHMPPTSWTCYSTDGATAARNSNLALGNTGPSAIHAYMADNGTPSLGHRRWLLLPQLGEVGTGDTPRANALWVLGNTGAVPPGSATNGVAWPPRGFVPWTSRVASPSDPWSFALAGADFSTASLTVSNDKGQLLTLTDVGPLAAGYGDNAIGWRIPADSSLWSRAPADTRFNVKLSNVKVAGQARTIEYSVTFFAP